jgi:leucine dehydrogenase
MINLNPEKLEEFDYHKIVQYVYDEKVGLRGFIAIHRIRNSKPSLGATRLWKYKTEADALKDALLLSKTMSYKSALAGLPYGGAKAVLLFSPKLKNNRHKFLSSYAKQLNNLEGKFITGTDVGITNNDVKTIKKYSSYVIGFKVDPAYYTAVGVLYGIEEALKYLFGSKEIRNKTFAIQGMGKTGFNLLKLIYNKAGKIFISDIDKKTLKKVKRIFPKVKILSPKNILSQKVDVFSPCAMGKILNSKNVSSLKCKIIAGSANNQLENENIDSLIYKLGILYVPDYVINAGGLISVTDELENNIPRKKRILQKIFHIPVVLKSIFESSTKNKKPTGFIADKMAREILNR